MQNATPQLTSRAPADDVFLLTGDVMATTTATTFPTKLDVVSRSQGELE